MKKILSLFICSIATISLFAEKKDKISLNIVYIGNSITQGALLKKPAQDAPPAKACQWLRNQPDVDSIGYSNQGISGATSVDFLPASNTYFPKVKKAADLFYTNSQIQLLFSIMLGTNDSAVKGPNGAPISPQQYYTNLKVIIDELLTLYPDCKIVLNRPIWYSPNTYNSAMYLKAGVERLEKYLPQLESLAKQYVQSHPGHVFMGDTEASDYYKANYLTEFVPEDGHAGTFYLHPNEHGAGKLGGFWGNSIYKIIKK